MWLIVEFLHDTSRHSAYTMYQAGIIVERLNWFLSDFHSHEPISDSSPGSVSGDTNNIIQTSLSSETELESTRLDSLFLF